MTRTIELKGKTLREDEKGRWTLTEPAFGLVNEPVFFEDVINMVAREQGKDAARRLDPMRSMREQ